MNSQRTTSNYKGDNTMSLVATFKKLASHRADCKFMQDHSQPCNCGFDKVYNKLEERDQEITNEAIEESTLSPREFKALKKLVDNIIKHRTVSQLNPHRILKLIQAYEALPKNISIKKDGLFYLSVEVNSSKKGKLKRAHLCLENILENHGPPVSSIFFQWAEEQTR